MTTHKHIKEGIAHSVHQKLVNLSKKQGEDPNLVFIRYAIERLLYRISNSKWADKFILKGAALFTIWTRIPHRTTKDLDLLGFGDISNEQLKSIFSEICELKVEPDGLIFEPQSIKISLIREEQEYHGKRITLFAKLGTGRINIQVDIGFGDSIVPKPQYISYPAMLSFPAPKIKAYSRETVIAEKLHAMITLGILNSRMKDFYDIYIMAKSFEFDGTNLTNAIKATFQRRHTEITNEVPLVFTDAFSSDGNKNKQWKAFLKRSRLNSENINLIDVTNEIKSFIMPPLTAVAESKVFKKTWANKWN